MSIENEWEKIRGNRDGLIRSASVGMLRVTLLFGSAAVALALILAPIADERSRSIATGPSVQTGVDAISTGSLRRAP